MSISAKTLFVLISFCFFAQVSAEEVIEQAAQLRKNLSPLGNDVVGKMLPDIVIENPYKYIAGQPGKYIYKIKSEGSIAADTKFEIHSEHVELADEIRSWSLKLDNDFIEEWRADNKGNVHLVAQTDVGSGYRVVFTPHLVLPAGAKKGQRWKSKSKVSVYQVSEPDTIAYQGELLSNRTYEGRFELFTSAGKFDAILISDLYEIQIGSVSIKDKRYTFYAADVGKIAEIDGFHVSAFIFYHKRRDEVKILLEFPGFSKN